MRNGPETCHLSATGILRYHRIDNPRVIPALSSLRADVLRLNLGGTTRNLSSLYPTSVGSRARGFFVIPSAQPLRGCHSREDGNLYKSLCFLFPTDSRHLGNDKQKTITTKEPPMNNILYTSFPTMNHNWRWIKPRFIHHQGFDYGLPRLLQSFRPALS
jgi:hypothetical protein